MRWYPKCRKSPFMRNFAMILKYFPLFAWRLSFTFSGYECICPAGYSGVNCEIGPCSGDPCQNGGICSESGSNYLCQCPPGFTGLNCQITPCTPEPCENNGVCLVDNSSYNCVCQTGFSGPNCEITGCTGEPCLNGGSCLLSGDSYQCQCPPGYSGLNCENDICHIGIELELMPGLALGSLNCIKKLIFACYLQFNMTGRIISNSV